MDVDVNDGVYVNDERRKFESDSGISFPVIRKEYWERALNQAALIVTATPKGSKGSLLRGRTSEFDNSGTASGISRSRLNEMQGRSWTGSQFPSEGNQGNAPPFHPRQGLHWRSGANWRNVLGAKP